MKKKEALSCRAALFALCLFWACAVPALAEERPPDLQACIDRAADAEIPVQAMLACQDESIDWWDKRLNANYRKAREVCATAPKPEECREKLQRAERLWIQYRDAMSEAFDQVSPGMGMGAMPSRGSAYRATRHQAEELDFFIRQGEELAASDAPADGGEDDGAIRFLREVLENLHAHDNAWMLARTSKAIRQAARDAYDYDCPGVCYGWWILRTSSQDGEELLGVESAGEGWYVVRFRYDGGDVDIRMRVVRDGDGYRITGLVNPDRKIDIR